MAEVVSSLVVGESIGQLELLNRTANKDVLCEFSTAFKTFYCTNSVSLVKRLRYRPFSCKFRITQERSKETFVLESVCAEVRNSGQQTCNVREKGTVLHKMLWNFQKN